MTLILHKTCALNCCKYICAQPVNHVDEYINYNIRHKYKQMKAGVFIYDASKNLVLLVQSRYDKWGSPKGTMESSDDSIEDCAIREVLEETGIRLSMNEITSTKKYRIDRSVYFYLEKSSCEYPCTYISGDVENDATGIGWIRPECITYMYRLGKLDLNSHCKKLLYRFLDLNLFHIERYKQHS